MEIPPQGCALALVQGNGLPKAAGRDGTPTHGCWCGGMGGVTDPQPSQVGVSGGAVGFPQISMGGEEGAGSAPKPFPHSLLILGLQEKW